MSESLNYLLGNFVTQDNGGNSVQQGDIQQEKMVCVDTSNGYLGFNTIDPSYHIDVCNGTIRTGNLILTNLQQGNGDGLLTHEIYYDETGNLKIKLSGT